MIGALIGLGSLPVGNGFPHAPMCTSASLLGSYNTQVQELSLDVAVINLGQYVFERMAYVTLSRVCTLHGVALLDLVADKIKTSKAAAPEMD